jgi:type II secretory pathway pseudopilin PulG
MTRLRQEDGFTLAELLVGAMLMVIVMSATLSVLDQVVKIGSRADRRVDLQDQARQASRQIARSLRNLADSPDMPGVVERAGQYDLVFRAVDRPRADMGGNARNLRRVRYCLDASTPTRGRILEQTQRWTTSIAPAMPSSTACPAADWGSSRLVADRVTNRANGTERALWTYGLTTSGQVSSVNVNLFMNAEPKMRARELVLRTGVFLRNQNRAPTATFTAAVVGVRHILLNASGSSDPEDRALDYIWYVNNEEVGRGLIFDYEAPSAGNYVIRLEVRDSGGLVARTPAQPVMVS